MQIRESGRAPRLCSGRASGMGSWDDAAVPPEKLRRLFARYSQAAERIRISRAFYGHFGHGCIHMRVTFDLEANRVFANTVSSSIAPPTLWFPMEDRFPASTETGISARTPSKNVWP